MPTPMRPNARCDAIAPRSLGARPPVRSVSALSSAFLLEQLLNGVQLGVMLFLMAAGLTLVFGVMGLINLAHGSLYMVGAFACAWTVQQTGSFWLGLGAGLIAAALTGAAVEVAGDPPPVRSRPPRSGAGHLQPDPDLRRGDALDLWRATALPEHSGRALGRDAAAGRRPVSGLSPRDHRGRRAGRVRPLRPDRPYPARHADPRGRIRPRDDRSARRRHPHPLHAGVRARRHARGPGGRSGRRAAVGRDRHGRAGPDPRLRGGGDRRHRLDQGCVARRHPGRRWWTPSGRALLPRAFALFLPPAEASGVGAALASVAIYLVMALVLAWRPKGLFPVDA